MTGAKNIISGHFIKVRQNLEIIVGFDSFVPFTLHPIDFRIKIIRHHAVHDQCTAGYRNGGSNSTKCGGLPYSIMRKQMVTQPSSI